jgi:hypothetical protein
MFHAPELGRASTMSRATDSLTQFDPINQHSFPVEFDLPFERLADLLGHAD